MEGPESEKKIHPEQVTHLLRRWSAGESAALADLLPAVRKELDAIAHRQMRRERQGHTLETGALVNEAYLKMVGQEAVDWQNRSHFFALAANAMRQVLVDHARARAYQKRGGHLPRVAFDEAFHLPLGDGGPDVLALDDALSRLAELDPRRARIVELRFFGGLSHDEIAEVLGLSLSSVERLWRLARAWLYKTLDPR